MSKSAPSTLIQAVLPGILLVHTASLLLCCEQKSVIVVVILWDKDVVLLQESSKILADQSSNIKERHHHHCHADKAERCLFWFWKDCPRWRGYHSPGLSRPGNCGCFQAGVTGHYARVPAGKTQREPQNARRHFCFLRVALGRLRAGSGRVGLSGCDPQFIETTYPNINKCANTE